MKQPRPKSPGNGASVRKATARRYRWAHALPKGYTLIEMLVYISILLVLFGAGYAVLFRCMEDSSALRGGAEDIADALRVGENWRADIRAARNGIRLEDGDDGNVLLLSGSRGHISYRFAHNTIFRRVETNDWSPMLINVKASSFVRDRRSRVSVWRWELELLPRTARPGGIRPLFTFQAVSSATSNQ